MERPREMPMPKKVALRAESRTHPTSEASLESGASETYLEQILPRDGTGKSSVLVDVPANSHIQRRFAEVLYELGIEFTSLPSISPEIEVSKTKKVGKSNAWQRNRPLSSTVKECLQRHKRWAASKEGIIEDKELMEQMQRARCAARYKHAAETKARKQEISSFLEQGVEQYPGFEIFQSFKATFEELLSTIAPEYHWEDQQEWLVATLEQMAAEPEFGETMFKLDDAGCWEIDSLKEKVELAMRRADEEWEMDWQQTLTSEQFFAYFRSELFTSGLLRRRMNAAGKPEIKNATELHEELVKRRARHEEAQRLGLESPPETQFPVVRVNLRIDTKTCKIINWDEVRERAMRLYGLDLEKLKELAAARLKEEKGYDGSSDGPSAMPEIAHGFSRARYAGKSLPKTRHEVAREQHAGKSLPNPTTSAPIDAEALRLELGSTKFFERNFTSFDKVLFTPSESGDSERLLRTASKTPDSDVSTLALPKHVEFEWSSLELSTEPQQPGVSGRDRRANDGAIKDVGTQIDLASQSINQFSEKMRSQKSWTKHYERKAELAAKGMESTPNTPNTSHFHPRPDVGMQNSELELPSKGAAHSLMGVSRKAPSVEEDPFQRGDRDKKQDGLFDFEESPLDQPGNGLASKKRMASDSFEISQEKRSTRSRTGKLPPMDLRVQQVLGRRKSHYFPNH